MQTTIILSPESITVSQIRNKTDTAAKKEVYPVGGTAYKKLRNLSLEDFERKYDTVIKEVNKQKELSKLVEATRKEVITYALKQKNQKKGHLNIKTSVEKKFVNGLRILREEIEKKPVTLNTIDKATIYNILIASSK